MTDILKGEAHIFEEKDGSWTIQVIPPQNEIVSHKIITKNYPTYEEAKKKFDEVVEAAKKSGLDVIKP